MKLLACRILDLQQPAYELGPASSGIDAGTVWEDLIIGAEHLSRWESAAVVTDVCWIQHYAGGVPVLMPGRLRIFDTIRTDEARRVGSGSPAR